MRNPPGYYTAKMAELRDQFGGKCNRCGSRDCLEFAHIKPNGVNGRGRGMPQRYHDIKKHSDNYRLLCSTCHHIEDKLGHEPPF